MATKTTEQVELYMEARPFVIGIIALLFKLRSPTMLDHKVSFDIAEQFIKEFEARW